MSSNSNTDLSNALSSEAFFELQKLQDQHQFEIAQKQIEATLQNFREQRECQQFLAAKNNQNTFIFSLVFVIFFFGFGALALWLGKENLLSDLLKVIIGAFGGGGIGYMMGSRKKDDPAPTQ